MLSNWDEERAQRGDGAVAQRERRRRVAASDAPVPSRLAGSRQLDRGRVAGLLHAADRAAARATRHRRHRSRANEQPPGGYGAAGSPSAASHDVRGLRRAWSHGRPETIWGGEATVLAHGGLRARHSAGHPAL